MLAKSSYGGSDKETIRQHTDRVFREYERFYHAYKNRIPLMTERDWDLLKSIVLYHDVGKADSMFQKRLGAEVYVPHQRKVPHNYLSVGLIPFHEYDWTEDEKQLIIHAVGYHHERKQRPETIKNDIREVLETDLLPKRNLISKHMNLPVAKHLSLEFVDRLRIRYTPGEDLEDDPDFVRYVLLKGLLHRFDHAASAHVPVETGWDQPVSLYVHRFMENKGFNKNPLQRFAEENQEKNVIAVAQTGMGKTEAGLLWAGEEKTFFTLPLRVSINALYRRVSEKVGYPDVGLLHSTAKDYLEEQEEENWEALYEQSRLLSKHVLFTTVDQILKFPFYYRGFEKELASMAGAKVIIDEIQAYDPDIAAMLVIAMKMIHQMGGKFMVTTATLPTLYVEKLLKMIDNKDSLVQGQFVDSSLTRHRIQLRESRVDDSLAEIVEHGKERKVLIIVNTVKQAVQVYRALKNQSLDHVYLLHSQFTREDRQTLEQKIQDFDEKGHAGVWVTTQLVEASLDIDFDELHTELSVLDSLFQRMGRCYRRRSLNHTEPNVFVYTDIDQISGVGDQNVYDRSLVEKGLALLEKYNGEVLGESTKIELVSHLYTREYLEGTQFLKEFDGAVEYFESILPYQETKKETQDKLRKIQNVTVIPRNLFDKLIEKVDLYQTTTGEHKRLLRKTIEKKTINLPRTMLYRKDSEGEKLERRLLRKVVDTPGDPLNDIWVLDAHYDFDPETYQGKGVEFEIEEQDLIT